MDLGSIYDTGSYTVLYYDGIQSKSHLSACCPSRAMLLAHGAESTLVSDIMQRIGIACGVSDVAVALSANALVVTTVKDDHCITTTRSCADRGINMRVITQIQRICIMMERGLLDVKMAQKKLNSISPERYNRWLVVFMIGLSCAAFSHLAGGDLGVFVMTFLASAGGMIVRQEIGHRHFNPSQFCCYGSCYDVDFSSSGYLRNW